jgi:ABC-type proline/glycine betaine transport system substrate-binding protein
MNGQTVTINLKEKENGKIVGISSGSGQGGKLEKLLKKRKIKQEIEEGCL